MYLTDCTRFDHWSTGLCSEAPTTDCSGRFLTVTTNIPDSYYNELIQYPKAGPDQGRLYNTQKSSSDGCWESLVLNTEIQITEHLIKVYIMQKQHVVILCHVR